MRHRHSAVQSPRIDVGMLPAAHAAGTKPRHRHITQHRIGHDHRLVAGREGAEFLLIQGQVFAGHRLPVRAAILGPQEGEMPVHRIAQQIAIITVREDQPIPEARRVLVGRQSCPVGATVCRLVEPALRARSGRHHDRRLRVPGPDAAEIQLLCAVRHRAPLPDVTGILGAEQGAASAAGPRDAIADSMNPA